MHIYLIQLRSFAHASYGYGTEAVAPVVTFVVYAHLVMSDVRIEGQAFRYARGPWLSE